MGVGTGQEFDLKRLKSNVSDPHVHALLEFGVLVVDRDILVGEQVPFDKAVEVTLFNLHIQNIVGGLDAPFRVEVRVVEGVVDLLEELIEVLGLLVLEVDQEAPEFVLGV